MTKLRLWRDRAGDAVFDFARTTQSFVVESLDQAVERLPSRLLPRRMAARATPVLDDGYALTIRLWELHREFAQRLADTMGAGEDDLAGSRRDGVGPADSPTAQVLTLAHARRRRVHG